MKPLEELNPIALNKEELSILARFAKRAERHEERFDAGSLQLFREWLWRRVSDGELDLAAAEAIYPLIVAARRTAVTERRIRDQAGASMEEQSEAARELFGEFPPPLPFHAPTMENETEPKQ